MSRDARSVHATVRTGRTVRAGRALGRALVTCAGVFAPAFLAAHASATVPAVVDADAAGAPQLDPTEVTVADYTRCAQAGACSAPDAFSAARFDPRALCNWQHPEDRRQHPVNCVEASQAAAFCAWAGKRLPSEAEWQAAATRAGKYPWGDEEPGPTRVNACGPECVVGARAKGLVGARSVPWASDGFAATSPVASFPLGDAPGHLSDLAGNVWEWTADIAPDDPAKRVVRGGSFYSVTAASFLGTSRSVVAGSQRSFAIGFRCIK